MGPDGLIIRRQRALRELPRYSRRIQPIPGSKDKWKCYAPLDTARNPGKTF